MIGNAKGRYVQLLGLSIYLNISKKSPKNKTPATEDICLNFKRLDNLENRQPLEAPEHLHRTVIRARPWMAVQR